MGHKGGNWQVHKECIVSIAKAEGTSWAEVTPEKIRPIYQVTLVRKLVSSIK